MSAAVEVIEFSADRLRLVDERLHDLDRLKRKYGGSLESVLAVLNELTTECATIDDSSNRREVIAALLEKVSAGFLEVAHELSLRRKEAAERLANAVLVELGELAMGETRFEIAIETADDSDRERFRADGLDRVEFLVATNPGDEPRSLGRIASGGETSRLMLALKTVSAPPLIPRTLVFDEIDVGIGGRVAEAIGLRLARLSTANQVLCVTHQAQIARFADVHHSARKAIVEDRAVTVIELLDTKGQVEELARMIGGTIETARRHAKELLRKPSK
jgi:DNA repair protein RecN (Recombination protein N)